MSRDLWRKNAGERKRIRNSLAKTLPTRCELCGQQVTTSDTWDVDHIIPISERPDLTFDRTNTRVTHAQCNRRRGAGLPPDPTLCLRGHKLEGDNVRVDDRGHRHCVMCARERHQRSGRTYRETFNRLRGFTPGPNRSSGERAPSLLERGECRNGHAISCVDDVYTRPRPGHPGETLQDCRECRRQSHVRPARSRGRGPLLERGECIHGHTIATRDDLTAGNQCRACAREYGRRRYARIFRAKSN